MSQSVFATLALAVPNLQELNLCEGCWDAALDVFGPSCPSLTILNVQAPYCPTTALQTLAQKMPNLTTITIGNPNASQTDMPQLSSYVYKFLQAIENCTNVTSLNINFPRNTTLSCHRDTWSTLPRNLKHMRCSCNVPDSAEWQEGLLSIPSLCLNKYPGEKDTLDELFEGFPHLREVQVLSGTGIYLNCLIDDPEQERGLLKQQLLDQSFQLDCCQLNVAGSGAGIAHVLAWLPPLPMVRNVDFKFEPVLEDDVERMEVPADCLKNLSRVFPNVKDLVIMAHDEEWIVPHAVELELLDAICQCSQLTFVDFKHPFIPTLAGIKRLCSSLHKKVRISLSSADSLTSREVFSQRILSIGIDMMVDTLGSYHVVQE